MIERARETARHIQAERLVGAGMEVGYDTSFLEFNLFLSSLI